VLWYDDVQWADLATRDLLLYRLPRQREAGTPHLLLLTVRSEALASTPELESWLVTLARQLPTTRLALGPLAPAETEEAIAAVLTDPSVANGVLGLGRWLYAQTEGQPFYLVETLRSLIDRGILVSREGVAGLAQVRRFAIGPGVESLSRFVPGTVHELIRSQVGGLSPPAQEVLTAAAVLGSEATFERLCQIADLNERAGLMALDELQARRLVVERVGDSMRGGTPPVGPSTFGFPHDLVREVVYTEAGDTRRRIFHRRAFALLEGTKSPPANLARHALMAGLVEPAFRHSVVAGDAALTVFAARDAIGHYEQAQHLLAGPGAEQWGHLHLQMGRAYEWVGELEQARNTFAALRRHAREAGDATLEGRALTRLAFLTRFDVHDLGADRALGAEALQVLDATEDRELLAEAHWAAAVLGDTAGDLEAAQAHARCAGELAHAAGRRELVAGSLMVQGHSAAQSGNWDESIDALRRGGALYAEMAAEQAARLPTRGAGETPQRVALWPWMGPGDASSYLVSEAICVAVEGLAAICRGEPHRGIELGHKALRLGLERANTEVEVLARYVITAGLVEVGHYEEALQVGRLAVEHTREPGDPFIQLWMVTSWASVQQAILDLEESGLALTEALARADQIGIENWLLRPVSLQCVNLALAGDWTGAFDSALQAVSLRETLQARLLPLDFSRHYEIEALVRGGNLVLAREDVHRLEEHLRTDGSDRRYWLVYHRMQAVLARGEGEIEATRRHLAEALTLARGIGPPGEEWQILVELAATCQQEGALAEAHEANTRARAVIATLAEAIKDQQLRDRFQAAALNRVQL
jgi:tetratricopeptide (TPR) repeat protein